jgi:imidazole glycerol-phosphate synthase subunit HisH
VSAGAGTSVAIFDYGAGNLHSLAKALAMPDVCVRIEADVSRAVDARLYDLLVLPGVGAFGAAADCLAPARDALRGAVADGFPVIGICLGMQLLLDSSEEGVGRGIGIIPGVVRRLRAARIPQIGWNEVVPAIALGTGREDDVPEVVYYANSFVCEPDDDGCVTGWSVYDDDRFAASVRAGPRGNVVGVQFHPEKSSTAGVRFLRALVARVRARGRS